MSSEIEIHPWSAAEYSNLALVQEVKKHPCLYNNTIPEYSRKDLTGRIWQEIAEKFGCSGPFVKKKWMRLRGAYMKDRRKRKKGKKTIHPLVPHMNFIDPFIVKNQQSNIHKSLQDNLSNVLHTKINKAYPIQNPELSDQNQGLADDLDFNDIEVTEFIIVEDDHNLTVTNSADLSVISAVDDEAETFNNVDNEAVDNEAGTLNTTDNGAGTFNTVDNEAGTFSTVLIEAGTYNTVRIGNYKPNTVNVNSESGHPSTLELNNNEPKKDLMAQPHESATGGAGINHVCHTFNHRNPRLHYVLSLLPEVDEMTERQFRFFQRKMLALIDEIKDAAI